MIRIDGSLIIQIVNFVFLIWILNILLYKPIRRVLLQRKEKFSGLEKSIQTSLRDAGEKDESFLSGIREARDRGLREKASLVNSAADDEKRIIHAIQKKSQEDIAAVREKISRDVEQVRETLQREIDDFAKRIGEKILGRTV